MRSVIYHLLIIQVVLVTAAQGSSCHYGNGCTLLPDVCSVPPPDCQTDWFGTYCQMHNIARAKRASQSSTYSDGGVRYDAGRAVDGNVNTKFNHGSCSVTDELDGGHASWHVFLVGTFVISRITIYLRQDAIDHNQAMEVLVNNRTCRKLSVTDIRDSETHLISNPMTLSCTQPIEGDTVTVVMKGQYLTLCEVRVFGKKKEPCHCSNGCSDFPNTPCSKPSVGTVCKPPWFGRFCQMENIAFQKATRQSSNYSEGGRPFCAAYAVDGNTDTDVNHRSCSHTDNAAGSAASWQVLLDDHRMFNISKIRIFLRNGFWDRNKGLQVLVNGAPCNPATGAINDWTSGSVPNPLNITCQPIMRGNNVTITISGTYLTLCEVQVFVCSDGWFGSDCCQQCQCLDTSEVCDKETGYCRSGCAAGKQGPGCQQDCVDGRYGVNCSQQCGSCKDGGPCNTSDGVCAQGCTDHFAEPDCKSCSDGWFGSNCIQQCRCLNTTEACDKITGNCTSGCRAGKTGIRCQDDCGPGLYGINCSSTCGHCRGSSDCNKDDGNCTQGCQIGYRLPLCQECVNKMYGQNCKSHCGRCVNGTCNNINGTCIHGCEPGFEGDQCMTESQTGNNQGGLQSFTGIIVGVVVGVLLAAVVVAVLVYMRRRRRLQKSHTGDQPEEDTTESSFSTVSSDRKSFVSSKPEKPEKPSKPVKPTKKPGSPANDVHNNTDTYYNVLPTPVRLDRFRQYITQKIDGAGFEQEYKFLRHGLAKEHKEGQKPENKKRNRFLALFPYDESRVVLAPDGDATCDYIHASYVQGFHERNVFIAAQGPNKVTVDDFWRMIWQENVSEIIMLTRVMEMNRKKCEQYWPDGTKDMKCGNIVIKTLLSTVRADFTTRKFLVRHSNTPSDKRTVTQLHFTSWPDHDVPSAPALVGFWKQYRSLKSSEEGITGPVVVHCSAGVGRTGTFIALDNLFDEAEALDKVNVLACVSKLREARMNMVQTVDQYRFVHESVLEAIESRGTFYTLSNFEGKFGTDIKYSRQHDMLMNREYQSLESPKIAIPEKLASHAYLPENVSKNRNKNIVPTNKDRPFLSTPVAKHNDYINAVILPSATQPLGLIATQTPLADTVVDFWRLVFDHDCFTIVCLEDDGENRVLYPRKNESLNIGPFRLTTLKEDTSRDSFIEMELNLALREQDNTLHQIRVFKVRSQIPGPTEPMLEFVNEIGRKGSSEEHKTLVHCLDGARLCGVFCSVLNIISRLRLDKEVDIYLTIRELQCIRPQFIQSYEQYKFCYDLVKEYLRDTSMYANM
ncbi:receptor-type tyrosine-protein phosphatase T-like [Haliotis asinina]|uniref:receptor-type tyrosine-protein phosphatase T-like n=1 Tax=Haliotis asinina TaxID=109174 RepID=UPI0035321051